MAKHTHKVKIKTRPKKFSTTIRINTGRRTFASDNTKTRVKR